jgi:hypothetical protein
VPLVIMMIPILPLLVQVDHLYSFSPLVADPSGKHPAARAQVIVTVDRSVRLTDTAAELTASGGVVVKTKAVRIAFPQPPRSPWEDKLLVGGLVRRLNASSDLPPEIRWEIEAAAPGVNELTVRVGDATATKQIVVAAPDDTKRLFQLSRKRHDGSFGDAFSYPGEAKLTGPIRSIEVEYPRKDRWWLWVIIYLIETIVIAFALRGPMKVDF